MLSLTLPWVDGWNSWFASFDNDLDQLKTLISRIDDACARVGRDPATLEKSAALLVQFGRARSTGRGPKPWRGTASQLAARMNRVASAGIHHVQLILDPITVESVEAAAEMLDELGTQSR
jgi:alkanesulfonate monooxygenase SsuD/methylene tetrahydromethanopterin reductase-like flavin-dependent oxidoreductase (luciferase family)